LTQPPNKNKEGLFERSARIARENWDEADKIFMKALMEPVDEELYKELTSNENNQKEKETK
tara:strand:+ start:750 stop:932 length:183 start_codon:yes stop_codon:yes gene_type:complete